MSFIWFWTFWHWTTESYRSGSLLRSPIHGIGGHWDEWFRFEAAPEERHAIDHAGRSSRAQRQFVCWLVRRWAPEARWQGKTPPPRFVLAQLATLPPFDQWPTFSRYRTGFGVGGVAAVVLSEGSAGESGDVRAVEALALPADADRNASLLVAEGFHADTAELRKARDAAMSLLRGKGFVRFLALWVACGRRPYPRALSATLAVGWLVVSGLILWLVAGPDPAERLVPASFVLTTLWVGLLSTAVVVAGWAGVQAWRFGRRMASQLEHSQVRLRMDGSLSLVGGSAGLPFSLNTLLSAYRVSSRVPFSSWLWNQAFQRMRSDMHSWAATGVIAADGRVGSVVLAPKLRACMRHAGIRNLLTPNQREGSRPAAGRIADPASAEPNESRPLRPPVPGASRARTAVSPAPGMNVGYASEQRTVQSHRCRHLADAIMAIGRLPSRWQVAGNAFALVVSVVMLAGLGDLRTILIPARAPMAVGPVSRSPYQLWVNLDTPHPEAFSVAMESGFWANRRANVEAHGRGDAPARAELRLSRVSGQLSPEIEDGTVWVERRRRFLTREFAPGERVGRFSLTYLTRLQ